MLSEKSVEQFRMLYKERFGEEISREEVYKQGMKLLQLIKTIYKPIKVKNKNNS